MKTFSEKTRILAFAISGGYCQCSKECVKTANEMHHKLANTKVNQRLFPLFIQSLFNCCPINNNCHMTKPKPTISSIEASAYEEWLNDFIKDKR